MAAASARPTGVIDLGLYHFDPKQDRDGTLDPVPAERGRGRLPRTRWWLPAAFVALLLSGPVAGGPAPGSFPQVPLWTVPGSSSGLIQLVAGEHDLYVVAQAAAGWALTAYRLEDGTVRWQAPLAFDGAPARGDWATVQLVGDSPVVSALPSGVATKAVTAGYDPGTGEPRWSIAGWPYATTAGGLVLLSRDLLATAPAATEPPPYGVAAVDHRTGQVAWTIQVEVGERLLFGSTDATDATEASVAGAGGSTHLVTVRRDGRLTRYDLATGDPVATVDTSPPMNAAQLVVMGGAEAAVVTAYPLAGALGNGLLYRGDRRRDLVAYDADTLAARWRIPARGWAASCGPVVCAAPEAGAVPLQGIDPVTGSVRWSHGCDGAEAAAGSCFLLPVGLGPGHVLVEVWASSRPSGPFVGGVFLGTRVIDAGTGELVDDLGRWRPLPPLVAGREAGQVPGRDGGAGWLLAWVDGGAAGGALGAVRPTWLARLHVDPVGFEVLGAVGAESCQPAGGYLLCRPRGDGIATDLAVWRIR